MTQIKVEYISHCGDDLSVVNAARCSFDKQSEWAKFNCTDCQNAVRKACGTACACLSEGALPVQTLKAEDTRLINYLATHNHFSPFNHSFISVRVKAPIFVARQLVKHKFMPWNEVSRRYVKDEPEFYTPDSWRKAAENVKQGSSEEAVDIGVIDHLENEEGNCIYRPDEVNKAALETYKTLLNLGVCAEEARMVLPQSMMTTWVWSGTLGAFCDMLRLRLKKDTQLETRIVAEQVAEIVKGLFPVSYEALLKEK